MTILAGIAMLLSEQRSLIDASSAPMFDEVWPPTKGDRIAKASRALRSSRPVRTIRANIDECRNPSIV